MFENIASDPYINIQKQLQIGEQIPDFGAIKTIFQQEDFLLNHKKGQVWLIDVWATWCGPCQQPMSHNQKMLQTNQKLWGDKVKIIGVSVDQDLKEVCSRVNEKKWNKIKHLGLGRWDKDHPLITMFNINGIPFVCLVDKDGRISYKGHPSQINLEDKISNLLGCKNQFLQAKQKQAVKSQQKEMADIQSVARLLEILRKQNFDELSKDCELFSIRAQINQSLKKGEIHNNVNIQIKCNQNDQKAIQFFKQKIGKLNGFKIDQTVIKYVLIPNAFGKFCQDCKKQIVNDQYFYWCKFEQKNDVFRCRRCCEQLKDEIKWPKYKNNSILTNGKSGQISETRFGKNLQPLNQPKQTPQYGCNGCGQCPQTGQKLARYTCLECHPEPNHRGDYFDMCQKCLQQYLDKDQQKSKQLKEKLESEGHRKDHALIRILFNVKGYFEY